MTDKETKKACVLGWPIAHSLSPVMHNFWLNKYNIDGHYSAKAVTAEELKDALHLLIDQGYVGCNLTQPHKEAAMALMDSHDDSTLYSGTVNTVVVKGGKLIGYDSDGFGFLERLKEVHSTWSGEKVVVIGTGGAARSIIGTLKTVGVKQFVLVNRTQDRAEQVVESFQLDAEIFPWERRESALKDATLLINGSSLGMTGQDALALDLALLPETAAVCDIVYRPFMTSLLQRAEKRGNVIIPGLGMLLHQGRLGFKHWFGHDPEVTPELFAQMKEKAQI